MALTSTQVQQGVDYVLKSSSSLELLAMHTHLNSDPTPAAVVSSANHKDYFWTKDATIQSLVIAGTAIFFLAFVILVFTAISFFLGYPLSPWILIVSCFAALVYCWVFSRKLISTRSTVNHSAYTITLFIAVLLISGCISSLFYDVSFDGQMYHQYAVYHLANGWNPLQANIGYIWPDHYVKGPWIYAAAIYKLIDRIEVAKAFNIAFIFGSLFTSYAALISLRISPVYSLLISMSIAFNPISICQALSFCVDGQLSSTLVTLASILCLVLLSKKKWLYVLTLISITVLLANLKFTSLAYSIILTILFSLFLLCFSKKQEFYRFVTSTLVGLCIGVFLIGYNPYITNFVTRGHPLYPLAGTGAMNVVAWNEPLAYHNKNSFQKLFISIFSKPGQYFPPEKYPAKTLELQLPFAFSKDSFLIYRFTDVRVGGFGLFFSLLVSLSLILVVLGLLKPSIPNQPVFLASIIIVLLTVFANAGSGFARYVPQLWLFPIFCAVFAFQSRIRAYNLLATIIIFLAVLNILSIGMVYVGYNLYTTHKVGSHLTQLTNRKSTLHVAQHPGVVLGQGDTDRVYWMAPEIHFQERGIRYQLVKELPCTQPQVFPYTYEFKYCIQDF
jgi:hypothetical protein